MGAGATRRPGKKCRGSISRVVSAGVAPQCAVGRLSNLRRTKRRRRTNRTSQRAKGRVGGHRATCRQGHRRAVFEPGQIDAGVVRQSFGSLSSAPPTPIQVCVAGNLTSGGTLRGLRRAIGVDWGSTRGVAG
jgi:hypothetical protein